MPRESNCAAARVQELSIKLFFVLLYPNLSLVACCSYVVITRTHTWVLSARKSCDRIFGGGQSVSYVCMYGTVKPREILFHPLQSHVLVKCAPVRENRRP